MCIKPPIGLPRVQPTARQQPKSMPLLSYHPPRLLQRPARRGVAQDWSGSERSVRIENKQTRMIYHRAGGQVVDVSTRRVFETDETRQEKEQASDGTPAPFMHQLNTQQHTTAATDLPHARCNSVLGAVWGGKEKKPPHYAGHKAREARWHLCSPLHLGGCDCWESRARCMHAGSGCRANSSSLAF